MLSLRCDTFLDSQVVSAAGAGSSGQRQQARQCKRPCTPALCLGKCWRVPLATKSARLLSYPLTHSLAQSLTQSLTRATHPFRHSPTHKHTHRSLTHTCTAPLTRAVCQMLAHLPPLGRRRCSLPLCCLILRWCWCGMLRMASPVCQRTWGAAALGAGSWPQTSP